MIFTTGKQILIDETPGGSRLWAIELTDEGRRALTVNLRPAPLPVARVVGVRAMYIVRAVDALLDWMDRGPYRGVPALAAMCLVIVPWWLALRGLAALGVPVGYKRPMRVPPEDM